MKMKFLKMSVTAILKFLCQNLVNKQQIDVRIGIFMVNLPRKVYSIMNVGGLDQKLNFCGGRGGHLGFCLLEKNGGTFGREWGAKFFLKGPKK